METSDHLRVEREDGVARLVLERPDRHNALDADLATDLADTAAALADDESVRCLVFTGTGGVFNTGADLATFAGDESDAERLEAIAGPLHDAVRTFTGASKPVVTGINGVVAGGGLGLALSGDVVLMSEAARLEYAYPKIGLSGDGGATWFLPRLLGLRRAQSFALLEEPIGAEEALERGLVTETVPGESFDGRLADLAADLASGPTRAYANIKTLFREGYDRSLDEHLAAEREQIADLAETGDYERGMAGFLEKESVEFEGR